MQLELAPLRRAQELLHRDKSADEVVEELRLLFGLDPVAATAAVAAAALLMERGATIPEEHFVRPFVTRHAHLSA